MDHFNVFNNDLIVKVIGQLMSIYVSLVEILFIISFFIQIKYQII